MHLYVANLHQNHHLICKHTGFPFGIGILNAENSMLKVVTLIVQDYFICESW